MHRASTLPAAVAPSSCRCFEIAGIVLIVLSILTGAGSVLTSGVILNDDDYYRYGDDFYYNAPVFYPIDGTSLFLAAIAIPLLFFAARGYQKERGLTSFGIVWMVLSWVFFAVSVAILLIGVAVQVVGLPITAPLFGANVVAIVCMLVYAEKSRKSKVNNLESSEPQATTVIAQQVFSINETSVVPSGPSYKDQTQSVLVDAPPRAEVLEVDGHGDYWPDNKRHQGRRVFLEP